jgi:hypothetical protein
MTSTPPLSPFLLGASIFLGLSLRRWRRVSGAGGQKRYREHYLAHLVSDARKAIPGHCIRWRLAPEPFDRHSRARPQHLATPRSVRPHTLGLTTEF